MNIPAMQTVDSEYKPWGGLAGVYKGEEAANKSFANDMALGQQSLALEKAALTNPLELIMKQRDAAQATQDMSEPMMGARQDLAVGTAQSAKAKGAMDMNALPEKQKLQALEIMGKTSKQEVDNTISGIEKFITDATSNGPMGMAQAVSSLPPQFQQMVAKLAETGQDPVQAAQKLRETLVSMRAFTEEHVRKQAEIKATGTEQRENTKLQGEINKGLHKMDNDVKIQLAGIHEAGANTRAKLQAERADFSSVRAVSLQSLKSENQVLSQYARSAVDHLETQLVTPLPNRKLTPDQEAFNKALETKKQEVLKEVEKKIRENGKREIQILRANDTKGLEAADPPTPAIPTAAGLPPIPPGFAPKTGAAGNTSTATSAPPVSSAGGPVAKPASTTPIIPMSMINQDVNSPDVSGMPLGGAYSQPWSNLGQLYQSAIPSVSPNYPEMADDFTLNQLARLRTQPQQR